MILYWWLLYIWWHWYVIPINTKHVVNESSVCEKPSNEQTLTCSDTCCLRTTILVIDFSLESTWCERTPAKRACGHNKMTISIVFYSLSSQRFWDQSNDKVIITKFISLSLRLGHGRALPETMNSICYSEIGYINVICHGNSLIHQLLFSWICSFGLKFIIISKVFHIFTSI